MIDPAMYPEGRTYFYEGDDFEGFRAKMFALGLEVNVAVTVHVPSEKLKAVEALNEKLGT